MTKLVFPILKMVAATVLLAGTSTATSCTRSYDDNDNLIIDDNTYSIDCGDASFCGHDNECHEFSCQTFFNYGPTIDTGNSNGDRVLVCNPHRAPVDDYKIPKNYASFNQLGVRYGCGDTISDNDVFMPYNERCYAEVGINTYGLNSMYNCYQYANDTDFDGFLSEVHNSIAYKDSVCNSTDDDDDFTTDDDNIDDFEYSKYRYTPLIYSDRNVYVPVSANSKEGYTNNVITYIGGANATKDFNKTLAIQTSMYSVLETDIFDSKDSSSSYSISNNWNMHHPTSLLLVGGVVYFFLF